MVLMALVQISCQQKLGVKKRRHLGPRWRSVCSEVGQGSRHSCQEFLRQMPVAGAGPRKQKETAMPFLQVKVPLPVRAATKTAGSSRALLHNSLLLCQQGQQLLLRCSPVLIFFPLLAAGIDSPGCIKKKVCRAGESLHLSLLNPLFL